MWLAFFNLDGVELVVILVVAILLFGDNLPQVARSMANSFLELKKGLQDLRSKSGIDDEIRNLRREVELSNLPNPRRMLQDAIRDAETSIHEADNGTAVHPGLAEQSRNDATPPVTGTPPQDAVQIPAPEPSPFERAAQPESGTVAKAPDDGAPPVR